MNNNSSCGCQGKTVILYFIRHGFSCANFKKQSGWFGNIAKAFSYDPPLTNHAIRDIVNSRKRIENEIGVPDLVLSSTLLRAQQTANFLFPDTPVYVAPFIKEVGSTLDNIANDPAVQKENDAKAKRLYNANRYDQGQEIVPVDTKYMTKYKFVLGKESNTRCLRDIQVTWEQANVVDYDAFIDWLGHLVSCLLTLGKPTDPSAVEDFEDKTKFMKIAVVGHSSFMAEHIKTLEKTGKLKKKPRNVGIVEIFFCLRDGQLHEVDQNTCKCPGIKTLQDDREASQSPWCNGVIFRGLDEPRKEDLSGFSTDNCGRM